MEPTFQGIRVLEVENTTSAEITYSPFTSYLQKEIYWFVVAGNDNGWGLPSEIRRAYFSEDPLLVSGKVSDENGPVPSVIIDKWEGGASVFSDDDGNFKLITRDAYENGFTLFKEGYPTTYTFYRWGQYTENFKNLLMLSTTQIDAIYAAKSKTGDINKGTVAGIVIDRYDQPITNTEVFFNPTSGIVC